MINIIVIFIPIIIGFISAFSCTMSDSGKNIKFRPPSWVFSVGWSILYILLGFSWYYTLENSNNKYLVNIMYSLLVLVLALWVYIYACRNDKKNAVYIILLSLILTLMCFVINNNMNSKLLIVPLFVWLIFALIMNTTEVQMS